MNVCVVAEYYPRRRDPVLGVWAHLQALAARDAGAEVRVLALERPVPPLGRIAEPAPRGARASRDRLAAAARDPRRHRGRVRALPCAASRPQLRALGPLGAPSTRARARAAPRGVADRRRPRALRAPGWSGSARLGGGARQAARRLRPRRRRSRAASPERDGARTGRRRAERRGRGAVQQRRHARPRGRAHRRLDARARRATWGTRSGEPGAEARYAHGRDARARDRAKAARGRAARARGGDRRGELGRHRRRARARPSRAPRLRSGRARDMARPARPRAMLSASSRAAT